MVYESGFTTRRTYTSRPVVSSYAVSSKTPIDWEKCPYVPRPSLVADPVTAFGTYRPEREQRKRSILDPINRAAIKPNYRIIHEPIKPYVPARDQNRERILNMVRQHIDTVEAGGNTAARTSRDSLDTVLPRLHRAASESLPIRRETYRNERSGATYPVEYKVSRLYKTTYPIYSTYTVPKRVYTGSRIFTSPVRIVTSPARVVTRVIHSPSPIRVVRTTTRVISSPERTILYTYKTPNIYNSSYLPATTYSSYSPSTYVYSTPSYYYSPISRVFTRSLSSPIRITTSPVYSTTSYLKRTLPGHGARALTNYLSTEPFATFQAETNRIRQRAQSLIRDIHSPVIRRARSCTPFPVTGYTYEPTSKLALDAYVERITNPVRHVAKEVHRISHYPEPARKYVGKSHLASVRICGDKAYNIRRPMYDSDKVRSDINLLSWYLRNPHGKSDEKSKENDSVKTDPELDPYRPSRKFSAPLSLDDHVGEETKEKQRLRHERLMTVSEEVLDEIQLEKKKALMKTMDDSKGREQRTLEESIQQKFKKDTKKKLIRIERKEQDEAIFKSSKQDALKVEEARLAEEAHLVENARLTEEARLAEETRKAEEDRLAKEARLAEESRLAEGRRIAEETRLKKAEEDRLAEEARLAEEEARKFEEARLAEEEARKLEEARLEEEKRLRDEELIRLAEIEKQAIDEQERELARQAAELAEIARQEAELAAQELRAMEQADQINSSDLDDTTKVATEPIIEEPVTPVGEIHREPVIELSTEMDELSDTETTSAAEEEDVEEV